MSKRLLIPLPAYGFDPTEVAIPWQLLSAQQIDITFLTPEGKVAAPDSKMLNAENLGIWKWLLRTRQDAVTACKQMQQSDEFLNPQAYDAVNADDFDGLLLPGGHDKGMRPYLESKVLQGLVVDFFNQQKPVGAICHGVVLAARSIDPETGKSVLHNYKTTALLKSQEMSAYNMTRLWLADYYLTYPGLTVEDEVRSQLQSASQFIPGPTPMLRDTNQHLTRGFTLQDRNYTSARWPGDIHNFTNSFGDSLLNS